MPGVGRHLNSFWVLEVIAGNDNIVPLSCRGALSLLSIKSNQKCLSAERLLCRTGPLPCKPGKTRHAKVPRLCCAALYLRFSETCYPPAAALPRIVLPGFARSWSADGLWDIYKFTERDWVKY